MRNCLVLALSVTLTGCGSPGKTDPSDDFAGLVDEKSDSFSKKMTIVGTLATPSGEISFDYSSSPLYRAIKLKAKAGDWVKATVVPAKVRSGMQSGDPVTWLLDSSFKVIAKNDDVADNTSPSQIVVRLKKGGTFYVVVRDYNYANTAFTATVAMARASGVLLDDANNWFQFFFAGDDYGVIAEKYQVAMSRMPQTAKDDANGFFKRDGVSATGYQLPYDDSVMYMLIGTAEEAYDAAPYDDQGRAISAIAIGGDASDIVFGTKPPRGGSGGGDPKAANEAAKLGFQHFYKCPDDGDVTVLGDTVNMTACWAACQAEGGAGCWYLDGTGGFARECRVCKTLQPVEMSWPNDWARNL